MLQRVTYKTVSFDIYMTHIGVFHFGLNFTIIDFKTYAFENQFQWKLHGQVLQFLWFNSNQSETLLHVSCKYQMIQSEKCLFFLRAFFPNAKMKKF